MCIYLFVTRLLQISLAVVFLLGLAAAWTLALLSTRLDWAVEGGLLYWSVGVFQGQSSRLYICSDQTKNTAPTPLFGLRTIRRWVPDAITPPSTKEPILLLDIHRDMQPSPFLLFKLQNDSVKVFEADVQSSNGAKYGSCATKPKIQSNPTESF
ncbi:hypothetical protein AVEN_128558-1 [Araneus ventricosus]|uniref:Uncharacterized protein n=1 Tax=Araneus ventricosus TaxID=182803 RepID=A0A4Y2L2Z0_ARAVE|nr:hypothetical protein AVEN_128558-1 [Araneus ventricosus]